MSRRPDESHLKEASVAEIYIIFYNCVQTVGWLSVLFNTCLYLFLYEGDWTSFPEVYEKTSSSLKFFQTLAVLEVVHIMLGKIICTLVGFTAVSYNPFYRFREIKRIPNIPSDPISSRDSLAHPQPSTANKHRASPPPSSLVLHRDCPLSLLRVVPYRTAPLSPGVATLLPIHRTVPYGCVRRTHVNLLRTTSYKGAQANLTLFA